MCTMLESGDCYKKIKTDQVKGDRLCVMGDQVAKFIRVVSITFKSKDLEIRGLDEGDI